MANIAVLVGSNYINTPNELGGCANDVRDIGELLNQGGFTTTTLTDAKGLTYSSGAKVKVAGLPTKDLILSNLNKMIRTAKPGDTLLFYYSGHGSQIPSDTNGSEQDYIVPLDAVTGGFDKSKLISSNELHNALIQVPQGVKLLMVADSCFSGNIDNFDNTAKAIKSPQTSPFKHLRALIEAHTRSESSHGALTLIAGCKADQESTDLGTNGALTAAIKEWIAKNSLVKWLTTCFDYTANALSKLKAALTTTIKSQGVTDQDPQISYDRDSGIPVPVPTPTHPVHHHFYDFLTNPFGFFNRNAQAKNVPSASKNKEVLQSATTGYTVDFHNFLQNPYGFFNKAQTDNAVADEALLSQKSLLTKAKSKAKAKPDVTKDEAKNDEVVVSAKPKRASTKK